MVVWFRKQKAGKIRRITGAMTGSVAACLLMMAVPLFQQIFYILGYVVIALLMLLVTFGRCSVKLFIKNYLFFLVISNCLAGILMSQGIFGGYSAVDVVRDAEIKNQGQSLQILILLFYVLSYFIPIFLFLWYRRKLPEGEHEIYDVVLRYGGKDWHGLGFLDTGNLLLNPMDGKPVVLLEKRYFEEFIGNGFRATEEEFMTLSGFCMIPYQSAGNENGMFYGVKTTEILLFHNGEQWHQLDIAAVCCENLIPKHKEYQILLSTRLFA